MEDKREKGTASVEFALILPLLLAMLFLIIEFSIILYDKAVITNASREGARSGIVFSDPRITVAAITSTVSNYTATNLISFGPDIPLTTVPSGACVNPGDLLTVSVSYQYSFFVVPKLLSGLSNGITLTGNTVMRCE